MRRFELHRDYDETGISGTGVVAEGVVYENGWCSMIWKTEYFSLVAYPSIEHVEKIHGHQGKTRVVFIDPEENDAEVPRGYCAVCDATFAYAHVCRSRVRERTLLRRERL